MTVSRGMQAIWLRMAVVIVVGFAVTVPLWG